MHLSLVGSVGILTPKQTQRAFEIKAVAKNKDDSGFANKEKCFFCVFLAEGHAGGSSRFLF